MSDSNPKLIVIKGYLKALAFCLVFGLLALYLADYVNHNFDISDVFLQILRLISVVTSAVGIYGMQGWEIQTWGGNTPQERLNKKISQILMGIGFLATVFTFGLEES